MLLMVSYVPSIPKNGKASLVSASSCEVFSCQPWHRKKTQGVGRWLGCGQMLFLSCPQCLGWWEIEMIVNSFFFNKGGVSFTGFGGWSYIVCLNVCVCVLFYGLVPICFLGKVYTPEISHSTEKKLTLLKFEIPFTKPSSLGKSKFKRMKKYTYRIPSCYGWDPSFSGSEP